jgi:hypothetical protein
MNAYISHPPKNSYDKLGWLWPLAFLVFGFACIALHQTNYLKAIPGDLGDARFNNIVLEHLFRWFTGKEAKLWSPDFFYPYPGTLTFSDNHFGTGLSYIVARLLGLEPERAFIAWYSLSFPLNYLSCYYVLRKFGISQKGSAVGAFLFTFALNVSARHGHAQLAYRFAIPLAMLAWQRLVQKGGLKQLSLLTFWLTWQFLCSIYLGYFLLLLIIAYAIVQMLTRPAEGALKPSVALLGCIKELRSRRSIRFIALILACFVALFGLFYPYMYYSHLYQNSRSYAEIAIMLPRPSSYLLADGSHLWGWVGEYITDIPVRWEHQLFFGLSAYLLAAIAILTNRTSRNLTAALALSLLIIITLYVHGHSLYVLIYKLPLANAIRAMGRIGLIMVFPLSILVAGGIDWLTLSQRHRLQKGAAATLIVVLMLVECTMYSTLSVPLQSLDKRLADAEAKAPANIPSDAILYLPQNANSSDPSFVSELDGVRLAQQLNRVTVNGYSGSVPRGFNDPGSTPCEIVNNRMANYAAFTKADYNQYASLVRRVVVIGQNAPCTPAPALAARTHFKGELPDTLLSQVSLQVKDMSIVNGQVIAHLELQNNSSELLPSYSDDSKPVCFSWRVIPMDSHPGILKGWDTRKDLSDDVPPGKSRTFEITIDPPAQAGQYRIEVTLVQENVTWFQQHGMPIAAGKQTVLMSDSGRLELGGTPNQ